MLYVVIAFLWAAICLYLLLGGADFGAGIVELVCKRKHRAQVRAIMYRAIGPVWEANHMWLIIAIVILFVGFPEIYSNMSIYMHIPLLMMLLGIIARGTAFAFRNYDAVTDDMQKLYYSIFTLASLVTPFFLGIIAAATVSRSIDRLATDFLSAYVLGWFNGFGLSVGLFTIAICGYLASIFAVGEGKTLEERHLMMKIAKVFIILVVSCGALVFFTAHQANIPLLNWIFGDIWGQLAISLASVSLVILFFVFKNNHATGMRLLAGFQVTMILFSATYRHYPDLILFKDGGALSLIAHQGAPATINALAWALLLGSIFILPTLVYLMYSFTKIKVKKIN